MTVATEQRSSRNVLTPKVDWFLRRNTGIKDTVSLMKDHRSKNSTVSVPSLSSASTNNNNSCSSSISSYSSNSTTSTSITSDNILDSSINNNTVTNNNNNNNTNNKKKCQRIIVHSDGSHSHFLKNQKRQENLSNLIKSILHNNQNKLGKDAVSLVPGIINGTIANNGGSSTHSAPPSLITNLVNAMEKVPSNESTLGSFEKKYGFCQEILGRGSFGTVRICYNKKEDGIVAVKEFKRKISSEESQEKYNKKLTSEFCISSSLNHINIVKTLDLYKDCKGNYCEVMEYCPGGDLFSLIVTHGKLNYLEADCFFKQLIQGVGYLHDMGICHRDLKPENLLLTSQGTLKITDFGSSECFRTAWEKSIHLVGGICGSMPYIAPEEFVLQEFDPRPVDIWACGVIYMAMRTGRHVWNCAKKDDQFYSKYLKSRKSMHGYEPIESLKRARCRNVLYSVLDPVPHRRITTKDILKSEWVREIKICHESKKPKN
ncbi:hypothetical protein KAFR_0I02440 [Kazachstania africana CBS 2517]|uniref:non-specific serine/threonine protein kinase n=1 Tax=Kazachstania africana (strain ATCC 22294 / BCRC 22015 / CBS 2517 / CECT 1963 / NBRC 1671 / NRRL Y-8276) TaxID=1071382 RepID=H2B073_KAZAF|nr:hypothetical protein KAFR_0I02440 [Kazachstania africana CBS 2517]CCF60023.1 hypothetical protein KAFR_0I02440 [Kazachstania africana CBS 2517]